MIAPPAREVLRRSGFLLREKRPQDLYRFKIKLAKNPISVKYGTSDRSRRKMTITVPFVFVSGSTESAVPDFQDSTI
jgi:hypothetical protein